MAAVLNWIALGYIAFGLNRAVAYTKARRRIMRALLADPSPAAAKALRLTLDMSKFPAWKRLLFVVLWFLIDVTTWPVPEVLEYRDQRRHPDYQPPEFRDRRWRGTEEQLTPEYASRGARRRSLVTCLLSAVVIGAAAAITQISDVVTITAVTWVIVLGTVARQVLDLLDSKLVFTMARRSGLPLLHAYLDMLLTAAADLLTLTFCSVLLLRWVVGQPLRTSWFPQQLLAILNGHHVTHLRQAVTQSPSAVLVGVAAITFYASLLGPLQDAVRRRRSGDELMAAAESALRRGPTDRARRLLELGRSRNPSVKAVTRVEGLLALSQGQVLEAWTKAQTLVRQFRPQQDLDHLRQREDGLFVVLQWCRELGVTPQPGILELARDVPVRDSMMACLVGQNADALSPDALPRARAAALNRVLDPPSWPLTFSVAYVQDGNTAAAALLLPAAEQVTGLDRLWRNQLARDQQDILDQQHQQLTEETLPGRIQENAQALLADVAASDITTWPEWQRTAFARALSVPLQASTTMSLDDELVQALTATRQTIAGESAEDAALSVLLSVARRRGGRAGADVR
jgi:hypothetical protein